MSLDLEIVTSNVIRMISGYRGTGKDTICQHLNTGKGEYKWVVYHSSNREIKPFRGPGIRIAFADELKKEVVAEQNLPSTFNLEKDKEMLLPSGKTFRQHCIEKGCAMRAKDPSHWVRLGFRNCEFSHATITISDWRYIIGEYNYAISMGEVITFRVFRKDVPIPPIVNPTDDPEHSLDHFMADYLILPKKNQEEEFKAAIKIFPQYQNYTYMCDL